MKAAIETFVFTWRKAILALFVLATVFMAYSASQLRIDAGFHKLLPLSHSYMETFIAYENEFGGANRVLVALIREDGKDIFEPEFFETLRQVTDEVFFIPGVDRARVTSLFTPNVRFIEIVEDGFAGGNVIPDDFAPTEEMFERVRGNVVKSGQVGRLVTEDFKGAMVSAELLEIDPSTGERLDYQEVAGLLEDRIRGQYETEDISVHIIGFAKVIGDVADGAASVVGFFFIALAITAFLLYLYTLSAKLTVLALACSITAVIWQLGMLTLLGFGIDPMSILVPFLVFAIGVSHGVQMISAWNSGLLFGGSADEVGYADLEDPDIEGMSPLNAARATFRRLLVPGGVALLSDTIGFLTILLIEIGIIQELAITASLGVAVIIITNLVLLPILLSFTRIRNLDSFRNAHLRRIDQRDRWWRSLSRMTEPAFAYSAVAIAVGLFAFGIWKGQDLKIGDLHEGVPELHEDSRYNIDSRIITERFAIGVDILSVIAEAYPDACTHHEVMDTIDRFAWRMRNVEGVHSVISLPQVTKIINSGWNEGFLGWRALPRNTQTMQMSVAQVDTATGLLNADCSAMQVLIFTVDHKAETIERIVDEIKVFDDRYRTEELGFALASGNVGVMAATNEAVSAAQVPMLAWVYAAIIALCLVTFRSLRGTLCIVIPLALVSVLAYALMTFLDIGLKVATLPVVVLGVGVGVDYGIYIYSRLRSFLESGLPLKDAYHRTLQMTGKAVLFTGITLGVGVSTWIFSALKFQADMGVLLTFMFVLNMVGAVLLLPALARVLFRTR